MKSKDKIILLKILDYINEFPGYIYACYEEGKVLE